MLKKVNIKIYGRIQGVFFRQQSKEQAKKFNLFGFAKNEKDGSVTIELEGEDNDILEFIKWAKKGPELAEVKDIKINYEDNPLEFTDFKIC